MNNIFNKIKKVFIGHYLKEKFNRLFDFLNDRTITVKIDESKKIIFSDIGKASGLRSRSILYKEKQTTESESLKANAMNPQDVKELMKNTKNIQKLMDDRQKQLDAVTEGNKEKGN